MFYRYLLFIVLLPFGLAAEEPVRLSVAGPMSGVSFSIGIHYRNGVNAAIKTLTDGTLLGRELIVSTHDDRCNKEIATKVAQRVSIDVKPVVVFGHSCSAASIAAAPIYHSHSILQISPASTSPKLTEMSIPTIFRMIGRDDEQGIIAANRIVEQYFDKKVGVLHFPGTYSRELAKVTIESLNRLGQPPTVVLLEHYAGLDSYATSIETFMKKEIDLVYLVGGGLDSGIFVRQSNLLGAKYDLMGTDTWVSKVFLEAAGESANGWLFTFPTDVTSLSDAAGAISALNGLGLEADGYTLFAYASVEVWIEGVKRSQSFDANKVADAIRRKPVVTSLGVVSFDSKGDIKTIHQPFSWYRWNNGQRQPLELNEKQ